MSRQEPLIHKHLESLSVPRDFVWTLLRLPISEAFPLVMQVRVVDLVLVKGCLVLVSIALVRPLPVPVALVVYQS